MPTLEDEFQKPVRDRLAEIVFPTKTEIDIKFDWALDVLAPRTDYKKWLTDAQSFQDSQVEHHRREMDDIARGVHGSIHGTFPTPTPRKRVRKRKR
jgi:hypothetical protein